MLIHWACSFLWPFFLNSTKTSEEFRLDFWAIIFENTPKFFLNFFRSIFNGTSSCLYSLKLILGSDLFNGRILKSGGVKSNRMSERKKIVLLFFLLFFSSFFSLDLPVIMPIWALRIFTSFVILESMDLWKAKHKCHESTEWSVWPEVTYAHSEFSPLG